jgi:hypothetical protein
MSIRSRNDLLIGEGVDQINDLVDEEIDLLTETAVVSPLRFKIIVNTLIKRLRDLVSFQDVTLDDDVIIDFSQGCYVRVALQGDHEIAFSPAGSLVERVFVELTQDDPGGRAPTWGQEDEGPPSKAEIAFPGSVAPVVTSTANARDVLEFVWRGDAWVLTNAAFDVGPE